MPLLPAAMQISAEAIPFAIAPVYSGYFTPYCSMNAFEPAPRLAIGTARTSPACPLVSSTTTSRSVDSSARRRACVSFAFAFSPRRRRLTRRRKTAGDTMSRRMSITSYTRSESTTR